MDELQLHYTRSIRSSLMADLNSVTPSKAHMSLFREIKVRQVGSPCCDKFVFSLHNGTMRAELLKMHLKWDGMPKNMQDVIAKAKALESAQKANKLITDASKGIEEQVNWMSHKQMKLKWEPGTCFWCGD